MVSDVSTRVVCVGYCCTNMPSLPRTNNNNNDVFSNVLCYYMFEVIVNSYHITCSKRCNYHIILLGSLCTLSVDLILVSSVE